MYGEIAAALAHGEAGALLTVVKIYGAAPCAPGTKVFVREDGGMLGTLGGKQTDARARADGLQAITTGQTALLIYHLDPEGGESVGSCGASLEIFVEPVRPEPRLILAGSGYVAQALARLATAIGWRVGLLDDRSEFVQAASLPESVTLTVGDIPELLPTLAPDAMTALVIVTRGHRVDQDALEAALGTAAGYVGMIGSPSKVRAIFRKLLRKGVSAETLATVHAPVGLDLGARTPDEIALSIAAELLLWHRGGSGESLRDHASILAQVQAEPETTQAPDTETDVEDSAEAETESANV
ncbi:MAG TPA: XdhC/CoxI family protein [Ktedonobacterales bacterium]|nr:XdhC/CoxI family protein [Ktedonobacterales bacterium]